ncbi:serine arginine-rich splicing factor 7-like [Lecanosticta acicola]|uniref:Serine arginine-rich splicing factor 7-like n=1 Tax=Lecanosticta acicola TaxID=111012 RepID=A0AAI8Z7Y4_9PEZI|nr:serine arginine-rich splicing factor 7-like [Lecanosticta acicola]
MDRSLDEIIGERPRPRGGRGGGRGSDRRPPPARAPRREEYPRDGVRKYRSDEPTNIDSYGYTYPAYPARNTVLTPPSDWVHDRYEDDRYAPAYDDERPPRGPGPAGTRIRVDNVHYELTEDDLRELFERVGPILSVRLLYDRADRSQGTAYVIYEDHRDAREAVTNFDNQYANGQPIRLTLMPSGPSDRAPRGVSLADRIEKPVRSLADRIEDSRSDSRDDPRRRRHRSDSPRKGRIAQETLDRYMPLRGSRSPIRRRGTPRGGAGRRPGQRREEARPPRRPRTDDDGRPLVGGRPRKTAEELDAEMADYWGGKEAGNGDAGHPATEEANGGGIGDIDMDI